MINEIKSILLVSAEGAFLQVTAFVGIVLILFNLINYKTEGLFIKSIKKSRKMQPLIGALLGLTPGCGAAIFIMPLFIKRQVSFGMVIATLIATMGDSTFVIISIMPKHALFIFLISFITAIITGYTVDAMNIGEKLLDKMKIHDNKTLETLHFRADHMIMNTSLALKLEEVEEEQVYKHIGHEEGDVVDLALHHNAKGHQMPNTFTHNFTHSFYKIYWPLVCIGFILGFVKLFEVDVNNFVIPHLGTLIGITGTVLSILLMIMSKKFIQDDTHEESELKLMSLKETIVHSAEETAFVGSWVFLAYVVYELGVFFIGGANYEIGEVIIQNWMLSAGVYAVIMGAVIGLIPGCGPQIIFVALFTKGVIPFAAVLANSISQDGDALFPLLAMDKRSSMWASLITTIPAVVVGLIIYYLEIKYNWFVF